MYINKWATFTASAPIQLSSGLTYCFPIWAEVLKSRFNLTQPQIEVIGSIANCGGYSGIIAGIFYDAMSGFHKAGPRLTMFVGVVTNLIGYLGLWACVQGYLPASFWHLVLFSFIGANGGTWTDVVAVTTNLRNFPTERGTVVGIMKAYVGLSASVYTTMYYTFFSQRTGQFLFYVGVVPATVALLAMPFINLVPFHQKSVGHVAVERRFLLAYYIVAVMASYQMVSALVRTSAWGASHKGLLGLGTLICVMPLLFTSWGAGGVFTEPADEDHHMQQSKAEAGRARARATSPLAERGHQLAPQLVEPLIAGPGPDGAASRGPVARLDSKGVAQAMPDVTPLECLVSLNFWLLFIVSCIVMGSSLMLLNNLAQVVVALGGAKNGAGVFTSVFSVANCVGRLMSGMASEKALHLRATPRPLFLIWTCLLSMAAMLLGAFTTLHSMFLLAAVMGIAFGCCWALVPALGSELFGLKHLGTNYCMLQTAPALGGVLMATEMAGHVYQRVGRQHGDPTNTCIGNDCYRYAFLGAAVLNLVGAVLSCCLYFRTRHIYKLEYTWLAAHEEDSDDGE